ncbi:DUF4240 domain-containing protein [Priestia megaterium]|nr:DUF4240 domain-containing protein [Priestia megaterium]
MALNKAFTSDVWGAAYLMMGGCSDDCFMDFRSWLIAQGEAVFSKVVKAPDYLADYISEENLGEEGMPQLEEMTEIGFDVYAMKKTGEEDPDWDDELYGAFLEELDQKGLECEEDIEVDWEDEEDLAPMFPKLYKRFGEESLAYLD